MPSSISLADPIWNIPLDGSGDATPGYNAATLQAERDRVDRVEWGQAILDFRTKPRQITRALSIVGVRAMWASPEDPRGSLGIKSYNVPDSDWLSGPMIGFAPGCMGHSVENMILKARRGSHGGSLLGCTTAPGLGQTMYRYVNCYLTADELTSAQLANRQPNGAYSDAAGHYGLHVQGLEQTTPALGIRSGLIDNVIMFGFQWGAARIVGHAALTMRGVQMYPGNSGDARLTVMGRAEQPTIFDIQGTKCPRLCLYNAMGRAQFVVIGENGEQPFVEWDASTYCVGLYAEMCAGSPVGLTYAQACGLGNHISVRGSNISW